MATNATQETPERGEPISNEGNGTKVEERRRNTAWIVGIALVVAGVWALLRGAILARFVGPFFLPGLTLNSHAWDLLFLPALGGVFLVWGVLVRRIGLLIPGGVLAGVGLGVFLNEGLSGISTPDARGGVVLASMGLGWAVVAILTIAFIDRRAWWPVIPAMGMGAMGIALLAGGSAALETVATLGLPFGLILAGVCMILRRREARAPRR